MEGSKGDAIVVYHLMLAERSVDVRFMVADAFW